jgi:hypothetical protein
MGMPDEPPPETADAVEESSGQVAAADASRRPADAGKPPDAKDARGTLVPPGQIAPAGQGEHEVLGEPVVFSPQPMQAVRAVAPGGGSTSGAAHVRGAHVVESAPDGVVRSLGQVKTPARQVDFVASGKDPLGQVVQEVEPAGANWEAPQATQVDAEVAPVAEDAVPAGQLEHEPAPCAEPYVPGWQLAH